MCLYGDIFILPHKMQGIPLLLACHSISLRVNEKWVCCHQNLFINNWGRKQKICWLLPPIWGGLGTPFLYWDPHLPFLLDTWKAMHIVAKKLDWVRSGSLGLDPPTQLVISHMLAEHLCASIYPLNKWDNGLMCLQNISVPQCTHLTNGNNDLAECCADWISSFF